MAYSLLIKNGVIVDGTGSAPYLADIGVNDDRIADIGNLNGANADEIIDASNLYIAPGFIDLTNHGDVYGSIFTSPGQESLLNQGITTVLLGNCGESLAPIIKKESFGDLERWTTGFSIPINWTGVGEYLGTLESLKIGVNVATLVGQSTLKRNAKDIDEMSLLLERALAEGAYGLSSNFNFAQRDGGAEEETIRLLKIVKKYDALYKLHLRDEGKDFLPSVNFVLNLARETGVRTAISHLKAVGRSTWREFDKALSIIRRGQEEGIPIYFDVFPYLRTGSMLISLLPAWVREEKSDILLQKLNDEAFANALIADLKKMTLHPEKILIASAFKDKSVVGKTLKEIGERTGKLPEEVIPEILKINELKVTIFGKTLNGKNLLNALKDPKSAVATDGAGYEIDFARFGGGDLAHPRSFGAYPRFLNKISSKAGLKIETAVRKITALPAEILGLRDRGVIRRKNIADLVIFHPEEFKDLATYKNPYQYSEGMKFLILNGKLAAGENRPYQRSGMIMKRHA